ncbi:ribosomal RNA processing protein 1 homolog [Selaginella moellendorffii]|uniref:ribosomal RNA processing protein 1 homolog n=1 Tax=Selaginella moellendorffii TaxID=88036 RepID=UPI000D1C2958|nr:ribosomal RNA processing protein 1 homolog [Selaginella moellendorffii]|eukprot:XP_024545227.1 ribosomal RNA processing protein 1 homolog [Selaginella moellendorffii]
MGNSLDRALGAEEELEVKASVVIRRKSLTKKDGGGEHGWNLRVKSVGDGGGDPDANYRHLQAQHREVDEGEDPEEEKEGDDDEEGDGDYDDRHSQHEQLELLQRFRPGGDEEEEEEYEEEEEAEKEKAPRRKRRRSGGGGAKNRAAASLDSSSKVSGDDDSASPPARKRAKGNGRPSSVTICSDTDKPSIDIKITRSHLSPSFTLNLPPGFVRAHINIGMQYRVINGGSCQSLSVHSSGRRFMVKRHEWRQFVEDQELETGDLVHLEVFGGNRVIKMEVFKSSGTSKAILFDEDPDHVDSEEGELEELIFASARNDSIMVPIPVD